MVGVTGEKDLPTRTSTNPGIPPSTADKAVLPDGPSLVMTDPISITGETLVSTLSETQGTDVDGEVVSAAVAKLAPAKKASKMRAGSSNTPR
jgi:hypothetical protein